MKFCQTSIFVNVNHNWLSESKLIWLQSSEPNQNVQQGTQKVGAKKKFNQNVDRSMTD